MTGPAPAGALGADLFWWRETGALHTLVTIHSLAFDGLLDDVVLTCVLHDATGTARASWQVPMPPGRFCAIDSARLAEWAPGAPRVESGVLAVHTAGTHRAGIARKDRYQRLYSMVDWYTDDGVICGLHNDQSIVEGGSGTIEFTEIVVLESPRERNAIVIVNGDIEQPVGALTLSVTNAGGASREARYPRAIAPFTVHRVWLDELFPALDGFGGGEYLTVGGRIAGRGLYLRPYVVTEGERLSAYHGGDVYQAIGVLPAIHYRLLGAGEVNPMAVIHRPGEVETSVNFFNSHGALEEAFWIDAELFDLDGKRVARRERWRCARRRAVVRADIAELLPDPAIPFAGHVAFTFTETDAASYPRRLQALMEYRSAGGAARVMAWSDEWNSRIRMHQRARAGALPLRSYYRVVERDGFATIPSITNAGHGSYSESAPCTITLLNAAGERRAVSRTLAPYATLTEPLGVIFPGVEGFLAPSGIGMLEVESTFDLANVQFVHHAARGVWAAEHYMAAVTRVDGRSEMPAGN